MKNTQHAAILVGFLVLAVPGRARTFEVVSTADAGDRLAGDGRCESTLHDGACTLRAAVQEANASAGADVVSLPTGRFTLGLGGRLEDSAVTGDLDVLEALEIRGEDRERTVIDASGIDRALDVPAAGVHLQLFSLTVRGGSSRGDGGGIRATRNATISLFRVDVEDNHAAGHGGGLAGGNLRIYRSLIRSNESEASGGGVKARDDLHLWWSEVTDNASVTGPALACGDGPKVRRDRRVVIGGSQIGEDHVVEPRLTAHVALENRRR